MFSNLITKFQLTGTKLRATDEHAWIRNLVHMDHVDALELTIKKISIYSLEDAKSSQRQVNALIKSLLLIDENSYKHVQAITNNFMRVARDNKMMESRIVDTVYVYHRRLYLSYKKLIDFIVSEKLDITVEQIHLLLARSINAAFVMAKWRYFQDQIAPIDSWILIHGIVKVAERLSLLRQSILLYENDEKEITLASLLVRGYMLDTLTKGSYSRQEIELTAEVLKKWIVNPKIQHQYVKSEHTFLINLDLDKGPVRVRGLSVSDSYRFWKTEVLVANIQTFLCDAETNKPLQRFNLNSIATAATLVSLFKKLLAEWVIVGYKRQRRHENRIPVSKMLNVHHGLYDICKKLGPNSSSIVSASGNKSEITSFELRVAMHTPVKTIGRIYQKNQAVESWLIVDESSNGLGFNLGTEMADWVEQGKLVGFSSHDNLQQFVIAEIRSIKKLANGRYRVGVEIFNRQSKVALISQVDHDSVKEVAKDYFVDFSDMEDNQQIPFSGVFLPNYSIKGQTPMMIIPKSEFKAASHYSLNVDGDERRVVVERAMSYRDDWVRVKVKFLS